MTEYEKQQIFELRMQGLGFKAIAATLGLTRDHVRTHCKRNGTWRFINSRCAQCRGADQTAAALRYIVASRSSKTAKDARRKFCSDFCRRRVVE